MRTALALALVAGFASVASAGLVTTHVDTTPGVTGTPASPYAYTGAGTGFGGDLGNGTIWLDSDGTNLQVGIQGGTSAFFNNVVLLIDSRNGGFVDADMEDSADGGRRASSNLANAVDDAMPTGFRPDFSLVLGSFGSVLFELTAGNTPGHLNFLSFDGNGANLRVLTIPLATLGLSAGSNLDFFAAYVSDSGYASNESIPANPALQANGNPGFGDGQFGGTIGTPGYENFNRFVVVPAPGALALVGLGGLVAARRRRA
jgi:hypothetical protein